MDRLTPPTPHRHGRSPQSESSRPFAKRRRISSPDRCNEEPQSIRPIADGGSLSAGMTEPADIWRDGFVSLSSETHDIRRSECHFPALSTFVDRLERAYKHRWDTRHDPYSIVSVLLLQFQGDDLGVETEIKDMTAMFGETYGFAVDVFKIPSTKERHSDLFNKVHAFVAANDSPGSLCIIYYGGHAIREEAHSQPIWVSSREKYVEIDSSAIMTLLRERDADIWLLFDSCQAIPNAFNATGLGIVTALAATGFEPGVNGIAADVGRHSFTHTLLQVLGTLSVPRPDGRPSPFTDVHLHSLMLTELSKWPISLQKRKDGGYLRTQAGHHVVEPCRRRTPIYRFLSRNKEPKPIYICPMPLEKRDRESPPTNAFTPNTQSPESPPRPTPHSLNSLSGPEVLISIRLTPDELPDMDIEAWAKWILAVPRGTEAVEIQPQEVRVEAVYPSLSTLVLLRMPLSTWNLIPRDEAMNLVGYITGENCVATFEKRVRSIYPLTSHVNGGKHSEQDTLSQYASVPGKAGVQESVAVKHEDHDTFRELDRTLKGTASTHGTPPSGLPSTGPNGRAKARNPPQTAPGRRPLLPHRRRSDGRPPLGHGLKGSIRPDQLSPRSSESSSDADDDDDDDDKSVSGPDQSDLPGSALLDISATLVVEEISDFDSDDGRLQAIRPDAIEDAESERSRSCTQKIAELDHGMLYSLRADGTGQAGQAPKGQKWHAGGGDGDDGDIVEGNDQGVPAKKHKTKDVREEPQNLRLSCPYRKRNPHRFNIREHESCAFTFYSDFSGLKQHIIRKHLQKTHGKFRCPRCNTDFDDHSRFLAHIYVPRDQMCESAPLDPEDGIDMPTSNQLLSRQGLTPNVTTEAKWKDIWKVLFPSDKHEGEIPNHEFHAPIEHFEVGKSFTKQVPALRADLQRGLNDLAFVETLSQIFQQRFLEVMESCNRRAKTMTYNNRRNQAPGNRRPSARAASNNNGRRPDSEDSGIGMQSLAESNRVPGWLAGAGGSFPTILPNNQPELSRSSSRGSSYVNNYHPYQAMGNPQYYNPYGTTNPDAAANSIARFNSSFTQPSAQRNRVSIPSEILLRPLANPHINTEMLQSVDPHTHLNVPDNLELQDDLDMLDPLQVASLNPRPGSGFRPMGFPDEMDLSTSEMQIPDPQQVTVFSMADADFMDGALPGAGLRGGGQEHRDSSTYAAIERLGS